MFPAINFTSVLASAAEFVAAYNVALTFFIVCVVGVFALSKSGSLVKKAFRG